jgi:hypothetical protein
MHHRVPGHHGDENSVKTDLQNIFLEEYLSQERNLSQKDGVWSAASMTRKERLYYCRI